MALCELLRGREHHQPLREPGPEHEVDVPCLPRAGLPAGGEDRKERHGAEQGQQRTPRHERPRREPPRLLNQLAPRVPPGPPPAPPSPPPPRPPPFPSPPAPAPSGRTEFTTSQR